jgi:hypothetical protein
VALAGNRAEAAEGQGPPPHSDVGDLAYHDGNIAALHRARPAGGPSTDTLRRAFARALTPGQRAGLKGDEPARSLYDTYLTRAAAHRYQNRTQERQ